MLLWIKYHKKLIICLIIIKIYIKDFIVLYVMDLIMSLLTMKIEQFKLVKNSVRKFQIKIFSFCYISID